MSRTRSLRLLTRLLARASLGLVPALLVAAEPGGGAANAAWSVHAARAAELLRQAGAGGMRVVAAQAGPAEELSFREFFGPEVGDRGLVLSPRLKDLHGKRVVISGFMVREQNRSPGLFVLAPWPAQVTSDGFCLIDEVPPASMHVEVAPPGAARNVPYRPGRLTLSGTLEVGPQLMADGRNAFARLRLDPDPALFGPGATGVTP